jgi:hypothetical protein
VSRLVSQDLFNRRPIGPNIHRREMKVIGTLADLGGMFGTRVTIRGWNTMNKIAKVLSADEGQ